MKLTVRLRSFLFLTSSALLSAPLAQAATLYWDGTTSTTNPDGGNGTWDNLTTANWDNSPYAGANTQWDGTLLDTAFFGGVPGTGGAGTVSLAAGGITTGGITFNISGYTIQNNTLTFGGTNNTVTLNNSVTAATINSAIGTSAANMTFTAQNPLTNHTLTFGGAGNWTGTTAVNAGMTLALLSTGTTAVNALAGTTGITINGGTITSTRNAGGNAQNQISSAAITFNGGGTMNFTNGIGGSFTETIGAVTVGSGQANFAHTNGSSGSGVVTTLGGLGRTANTAAVTFSNANATQTSFLVSGAADTLTDEIVGPWATIGTAVATQTDYAIYTGANGTAAARNILASAASGWSTTSASTSNYTMANASGSAANGKLANSVNVNTVRNTTTATGVTATNGTDVINLTSHGFSAGDVVVFGGTTVPTGLNFGQPYYVINTTTDTFQVSTTSGGGAALFTADGASVNITGGITLPSGISLGTYGILNGSAAALAIGGNGGTITLPTAAAGNLYVTSGNAQIQIDAPIVNPGVGQALTLVKSGNAALTLRGTNTFTGGIVVIAGSVVVTPTAANGFIPGAAGGDIIHGGNLTYSSANAWGVTGRDVTFNGTGSLTSGAYTGGTLTVNSGANAQIANSATLAFATTTGTGTIINTPSANTLLNLGNASGFTGNVQNRGNSGGTAAGIQFSSLGDGGALQFAGGNSDSNQTATFTYNGTGTLTFGTRQVQILDRLASNWEFRDNILANNSANGGNNWVINTDLLVTGGRWITAFGGSAQTNRGLVLSGSNTDANAFNGVISNGTNPNGIFVSKTGSGKWIVSGANTYSGTTTVNGASGTLIMSGTNSSAGNTTLTAGTLQLNNASNGGLASGTLILNGGTLQAINAGRTLTNTVSLNANSTISGSESITFSSGTLTGLAGADRTLTNNLDSGKLLTLNDVAINSGAVARTLFINGTGDTNITGVISSGAGFVSNPFTKGGAGTLTLSGANIYGGNTAVNGGILKLANSSALGFGGPQTTATGTTTVNSGFTLDLNGTTNINEPIIVSGTGIGGNGALINTGADASIGNGIAGLTIGAASTGSGYSTAPAVTISGTGTGATATATLGVTAASFGAPTVTGTPTAATVAITGGGGTGATATITAAGVITIVNPGTGYTSAPTITATVTAGTGTITYGASNADNFTVSGVQMTAAGSGYTGTPTYTFDSGNATPGSATLSTVTLAADSSIGGSGNLAINAVVGESSAARALTKVGAGTLTLNGSNTYTGATTVNGGKLFVNGDQTAATGVVSVAATATLGGTGTLGGNTTIDDTGKLEFNLSTAPGSHNKLELASGKTLTFSGASVLTLTSSGGATTGLYTLVTAPGASSIIGSVPATVNLPLGWTADPPQIVTDGPDTSLKINITSVGGGGATYSNWASLNSAGPNLADDHDGDGVDNGTEYFIGGPAGNTTGFTPLPGVTHSGGTLSVTWVKGAGYTGNYTTDFVVETSDTLTAGSWTTASTSGIANTPNTVFLSGSNVTYTFPTPLGAKKFARLKVTGP